MTINLPWKTWLVALAIVAAVAFFWSRERRLRADAQRDAEAARLELKNQLVEHESTRRELQQSVADLLSQNKALAAAFDDAMAAAPDARPASASRLDTGALEARATPIPVDAPKVVGCSLRPGDKLSVKVDILELETKLDNTLIVGAAAVWRETPPPPVLLAEGKFQSSLSTSRELERQAPPGWGALAIGACGFSGCGLGGAALLPPITLPLVGWRAEALVGGVVVPGGPLVLAGLGGRF